MFNKKCFLILLLMLILFTLSSVSANDLNVTDDALTVGEGPIGTGFEENLSATNVEIYFDASATTNGDGSMSRPYKYVDQNMLNVNSGNYITAFFADGVYELNSPFKISSDVVLIGESRENTIFTSVLSDKYNFEIMQNSNLQLQDMTFEQVNILNHGTFEAYDVNFNNGEAFTGKNAPSIKNAKNYNSSYGGVIICNPIGNSQPYVYLNKCVFDNNIAYCGGAISLKDSRLDIISSNFSNSQATCKGGVIYAVNSNINIQDSDFNTNNAKYGGVIFCENGIAELKNVNLNKSQSYSFGGAIASKYSTIDIDSCNFMDYASLSDAGGAIYNLRGNLKINGSSFHQGFAKFGGAIANLESNLNVYSSIFEDNAAEWYGGVIYNIYGKMIFEENKFYRANASQGGAIRSELSDSLFFRDNVFMNMADDGYSCIYVDTAKDITQTGNFFEDEYHIYLEYEAYVKTEDSHIYDKMLVKSNVLNYILSNNGIYFNNYEKKDSSGNYSEFVSLNIYDSNYPDNDTIFGYYGDDFTIRFNLKTFHDHFYPWFRIIVCNGAGKIISEKYYHKLDGGTYLGEDAPINNANRNKLISDFLYYDFVDETEMNAKFSINFNQLTLFNSEKLYESMGESVSLINSYSSDLNYIPSSYDSRDYGYITPVKDQANGGNCWAFAGIATLEACIKKITNVTYDFSEENAKNMMASFSPRGLDIEPNEGGYDYMMMSYLTNWFGPIPEEYDAYDDLSSLSIVYKPTFHIQNIKFLPFQNTIYLDEYKKAIMDYGAVSVSLYWTPLKGYHAVSIVGWDDNYNNIDAFGNYATGAWIIKNSWGTDWEDNGFGYLSYDIPFVNIAYTFIFNNDSLYSHYWNNIRYDFSGVGDYICHEGPIYSEVKLKNEFDKAGNIYAFGTYFLIPTHYTVSVFKYDTLISYQEGYSDAGYYTIPFNKTIFLNSVENCVVRITFDNEEINYLPVCQAEELTKSHFHASQTFCSFDGENFEDLYNLEGEYEFLYKPDKVANTCQSLCINFIAGSIFNENSVYIEVNEFDNVNVGEDITINVTLSYEHIKDESFLKSIEDTLVTLTINGKDYYARIHDGNASLNISFDEAGVYTIAVKYLSNKYPPYRDATVTFNFTVNPIDTKTSLTSTKNARDNVTLTAAVDSSEASGDVVFNVNGVDYTAKVIDGVARYTLSNLDAGSYTAKATYGGNNKYKVSTSTSISFNVEDIKFKLSAQDLTKYYHGPERFAVTIRDKDNRPVAGENVTITLNGLPYTRTTDANGQASMAINLNSGIHNAITEYGDERVKSTITVKPTISGNNVTKIFRNGTQYYATFVDKNGNLMRNTDVNFNINGVFYTRKTNENGVARMNINLNPGEYIITAINPDSSEQYTNIITVLPSIVENYDLTKYYKNASRYSLRVLDDNGNPVGAGVDVKLNINGVFYTRTSDDGGYVKMNINLEPGEYTITAEYNGLMASNKIKVLPVIETKNLVMKYKDGSRFEAKILDGQGKPYPGQKVTFNINGVFYEKVTDENGFARLKINLMAGEYIITSSYNGLNAANKVTISS